MTSHSLWQKEIRSIFYELMQSEYCNVPMKGISLKSLTVSMNLNGAGSYRSPRAGQRIVAGY
jgi:hypothetical protein